MLSNACGMRASRTYVGVRRNTVLADPPLESLAEVTGRVKERLENVDRNPVTSRKWGTAES